MDGDKDRVCLAPNSAPTQESTHAGHPQPPQYFYCSRPYFTFPEATCNLPVEERNYVSRMDVAVICSFIKRCLMLGDWDVYKLEDIDDFISR